MMKLMKVFLRHLPPNLKYLPYLQTKR